MRDMGGHPEWSSTLRLPGPLQPFKGSLLSQAPLHSTDGGLEPATPITQDVGRTGTDPNIKRLPQRRRPGKSSCDASPRPAATQSTSKSNPLSGPEGTPPGG